MRKSSSSSVDQRIIQSLRLLSDSDSIVREEALVVLWSLAVDPDNKVEIVAIRGALESIVRLLWDPNPEVREMAAGVLWNLAVDNLDNKVSIAAIKWALEGLVSLLSDINVGVRERAAAALGSLAINADIQMQIALILGALEAAVGLLWDPHASVREKAAALLGNLAANADIQLEIRLISGALESLVRLLQDSHAGVRKMVVIALENLAFNADNEVEIAAIKEALKKEKPPAVFSLPAPVSKLTHFSALIDHHPSSTSTSVGACSASSFSSHGLLHIRHEEITLHELLGKGGFGVVHRAEWKGTPVAVKHLRADRISESSCEKLQSEALLQGALDHPNVVKVIGVCREAAKLCLVMELMVGGSLYNLLRNGQVLPWSLRFSIAKDIAAGLHCLHGHEPCIVHGDLKSANILLDDRGRARIADFGNARVLSDTEMVADVGASSAQGGTVHWAAPELFERGSKLTELSDIYAFGMTLWELAARKAPFEDGRGDEAVIAQWIIAGKKETIPQKTPVIFARLISQCWAQRAKDRPLTDAIIVELEVGATAEVSAATATGIGLG